MFLSLGDLRFEYEYEIEYENDFSILLCRLQIITTHTHFIPWTTPLCLNPTGRTRALERTDLKIENRTRTQSCTRSPILSSLFLDLFVTSLQWRLMQGNIINKSLSFAFEKNLHSPPLQASSSQYREDKHGLFQMISQSSIMTNHVLT